MYEQSVPACAVCTSGGVRAGYGTRVVWVGGYTGWVIRVPGRAHRLLEERYPDPAERARRPCRGRSGGVWVARTYGGRGRAPVPPSGPGRSPWALPVQDPWECPPRTNTARFDLIFHKVSQNGEVSLKSVHEASHSPCFNFRVQKSPLDISRFPFLVAFSHKELMTLF